MQSRVKNWVVESIDGRKVRGSLAGMTFSLSEPSLYDEHTARKIADELSAMLMLDGISVRLVARKNDEG